MRVDSGGLQVTGPGPSAIGPPETVRQFYALINIKSYAAAWSLLSPRYQATTDYASWVAGYTNTLSVTLVSVTSVDPTTVAISVTATDNASGRIVGKTFEGTWTVVQVNGAWKLDVGKIRQLG